jgi:hypothetical protein
MPHMHHVTVAILCELQGHRLCAEQNGCESGRRFQDVSAEFDVRCVAYVFARALEVDFVGGPGTFWCLNAFLDQHLGAGRAHVLAHTVCAAAPNAHAIRPPRAYPCSMRHVRHVHATCVVQHVHDLQMGAFISQQPETCDRVVSACMSSYMSCVALMDLPLRMSPHPSTEVREAFALHVK